MTNERRIADVWANYWGAAFFESYPQMAALYARLGMTARAGATRDTLSAEARKGRVDRIVLSATDFTGLPVDNRVVADVVAEAPTLLVATRIAALRGAGALG